MENTHLSEIYAILTSAILKGDYHLIYTWETRQIRLYNVKKDISEQNDLAQTMPDNERLKVSMLQH